MILEDFTYEHQIIRQADYLTSTISDGKIGGSPLYPTTILLTKLFIYKYKIKNININKPLNFSDLWEIINDYSNLTLNKKLVNALTAKVKEELGDIQSDGTQLHDIIIYLKFLILLRYLDKYDSYNFLPLDLIETASQKIKAIGNNGDFKALLDICSNNLDEATFPQSPIKDIQIESLIQLALNNIIMNTQKIDIEFSKKIKIRKLKFIKNVYDDLDMFKNPERLMNPGKSIIEGILSTAITLIVLNYSNTISLNRCESEEYIDKELDEKMIEQEINNKVEEKRKEIIYFTLPFQQFADKYKVPMFYGVFVYIALWIIFSFFLYMRYAYALDFTGTVLVIFSGYLLYESYIKSKAYK